MSLHTPATRATARGRGLHRDRGDVETATRNRGQGAHMEEADRVHTHTLLHRVAGVTGVTRSRSHAVGRALRLAVGGTALTALRFRDHHLPAATGQPRQCLARRLRKRTAVLDTQPRVHLRRLREQPVGVAAHLVHDRAARRDAETGAPATRRVRVALRLVARHAGTARRRRGASAGHRRLGVGLR